MLHLNVAFRVRTILKVDQK